MDAGCLQEFSPVQTPGDDTKQPKRSITQTLGLWHERSRQRRDLLKLANDISLLDDVGLSLYDIRREARKHFWNE